MNAWLAQLAPAHPPPPPGWWPPAPGWSLAAVLAALVVAALWVWRRHPVLRLRRRALRELARIEAAGTEGAELARAVESLMRRYAVARFGREAVARLTGARWLEFVAAHGGGALAGEAGHALLRAAYGAEAGAEAGGEAGAAVGAEAGRGAHAAQWLAGVRHFVGTRRGRPRPP